MKILSLFDGMACGYIAFKNLGVEIDEYHAYEIDKYATKTATHNFPDIKEHGDVFAEDFSKYSGSVDWLIGGSPCTYWSIAQTKNRETVASGMGWELFSQYVRALHEAKPKYFLYENNKSMSQAIRESICEAFGFEPVLINSALVSAQNRQRLYWVGIRQEDGTYKKAEIAQPEDRGILLKHVLDTAIALQDKAYACMASQGRTTEREYFIHHQGNMAAEPINTYGDDGEKARTLMAGYYKYGTATLITNDGFKGGTTAVAEKVLSENEMDYMVRDSKGNYSDRWLFLNKPAENDKSVCITANVSKGVPYNVIAEPVNVTEDGKAQVLKANYYKSSVANFFNGDDGMKFAASGVAEPICVNSKSGRGGVEGIQPSLQDRIYSVDGKMTAVTTSFNPNIAEPVRAMNYDLDEVNDQDSGVIGKLKMDGQHDICKRIYGTNGKSPTLVANSGGNYEPKVFEGIPECFRIREATTQGYTDIEPGDCVDYGMPNSKTRRGRNMKDKSNCLQTSCSFYQYCGTVKAPIYEVKDGMIEVKGKRYPIKLVDGYYIIRKLTVTECMRLQTVPEWYEWPVSNSQAYKMLGNGWTVEVIMHLIKEATK